MMNKRKKQSEVEVYQVAQEDWALDVPDVRAFYALPSLKQSCCYVMSIIKHTLCFYERIWRQQRARKQYSAISHVHGFYSAFHERDIKNK